MMHALTPAADLDVSVRARRLACVLDPALLLAAPHALLLAQQLSRTMDLWVCPGFWRLLDASEFFARRPTRLRAWLALASEHPTDSVGAAIECWSRWRATRDLSALGLYWVGGHQTESFLPENGPRDLPARFEGLVEAWMREADGGAAGEEAMLAPEDLRDAALHAVASVKRLPVMAVKLADNPIADAPDAAPERDEPTGPAQRHEGVLESAALSAALQAPVLTLAGAEGEAPALVRQWSDCGLSGVAWTTLHPVSASAEQQRWWQATVASGAAATVASAAAIGLRLALAQVVAPSGQCLVEREASGDWIADLPDRDEWGDGEPAQRADAASAGAHWWRDAQALWFGL